MSDTTDMRREFVILRLCIKCGFNERNTKGNCKACSRVVSAKYRADNREKVLADKKRYRQKNSEAIKLKDAKYRLDNKDSIRIIQARSRIKHPEKKRLRLGVGSDITRQRARAYYAKNKEACKANTARWMKANANSRRVQHQNRRAKIGKLSRGLVDRLIVLQQGMCPCCNQPLRDKYHLDHILPLALGGSSSDNNMQLLRATCNLQKHAKHPIDFMQGRGFLL